MNYPPPRAGVCWWHAPLILCAFALFWWAMDFHLLVHMLPWPVNVALAAAGLWAGWRQYRRNLATRWAGVSRTAGSTSSLKRIR